jgi:hypothetical protein
MAGQFAERHFAERQLAKRQLAERHFAERTFCRWTFFQTDVLRNGRFAKRDVLPNGTFCQTDILLKIEISSELYRFAYTVKISVIKVIVDFDDRNFDSEVQFRFIFFQVFDKFTEISRYKE